VILTIKSRRSTSWVSWMFSKPRMVLRGWRGEESTKIGISARDRRQASTIPTAISSRTIAANPRRKYPQYAKRARWTGIAGRANSRERTRTGARKCLGYRAFLVDDARARFSYQRGSQLLAALCQEIPPARQQPIQHACGSRAGCLRTGSGRLPVCGANTRMASYQQNAVIQYAEALRFFNWRSGILGPLLRGGDEVLGLPRRVSSSPSARIDRPRVAEELADRNAATRRPRTRRGIDPPQGAILP